MLFVFQLLRIIVLLGPRRAIAISTVICYTFFLHFQRRGPIQSGGGLCNERYIFAGTTSSYIYLYALLQHHVFVLYLGRPNFGIWGWKRTLLFTKRKAIIWPHPKTLRNVCARVHSGGAATTSCGRAAKTAYGAIASISDLKTMIVMTCAYHVNSRRKPLASSTTTCLTSEFVWVASLAGEKEDRFCYLPNAFVIANDQELDMWCWALSS